MPHTANPARRRPVARPDRKATIRKATIRAVRGASLRRPGVPAPRVRSEAAGGSGVAVGAPVPDRTFGVARATAVRIA